MSHYNHLSIDERENILILCAEGHSMRIIAKEMNRSVSTVSRELKRNRLSNQKYSAIAAQKKYNDRRKKCRRHKLLSNADLKEVVRRLFLEQQWSPEQISNRLAHEANPFAISYATIYRAIYAGVFDTAQQIRSDGNRGAIRKLRHKGRSIRRKGTVETRGKIVISNRIKERPFEAEERQIIGHWEADTIIGKIGSACLVTITDRCSRFLVAGKISKRYSALLADKMIELLSMLPSKHLKTITPDRGKEFARHEKVTSALDGVQFYFADPHAPWQRGTNENTNGLLREYLPKAFDIAFSSQANIDEFIRKLNFRPRKCLNWKTPHEIFFNQSLHLT